MTKRLRFVARLLAAGFAIVVLNLTYLQVIAAPRLASHANNARALESEFSQDRGRMVSADGAILAETVKQDGTRRRVYPAGKATAHITGFLSRRYGRAGLEQALNSYLAPPPVTSVAGYLAELRGAEQRGADVTLTLDLALQQTAIRALAGRTGAVVALDPRDGAILALVSEPTYDPNAIDLTWNSLRQNKSSPLVSRALNGLYPPGSTFKVVTAAAALEAGVTSPSKTYQGPSSIRVHGGRVTNFADQGYGTMQLHRAFALSTNTIFAQVGLAVGGDRLVAAARRFGLGYERPAELPLEISAKTGSIPAAGSMDDLEVAWTSVGQGRLLVTPTQMALIAAAVANNGSIATPHLVREVTDAGGAVVYRGGGSAWQRPISPATAEILRDFMVEAVESGTGRAARVSGVSVAGKTGTAEPAEKAESHAWFVGFAPAEAPTVAVAVIVENGGTGGRTAAPIAKQVLEAALKRAIPK